MSGSWIDRSRHWVPLFLVAVVAFCPGLVGADAKQKFDARRVWERKLDDGRSIVVEEWADKGTPIYYTWRCVTDANQDGPVLFQVDTTDCIATIPRERFPVKVLYAALTPRGDLMTVFNQRGNCLGVIRGRSPPAEMPGLLDRHPTERRTDGRIVGPALKSTVMDMDDDGVFHITGEDEYGEAVRYDLRTWAYFHQIVYFWQRHVEVDEKR